MATITANSLGEAWKVFGEASTADTTKCVEELPFCDYCPPVHRQNPARSRFQGRDHAGRWGCACKSCWPRVRGQEPLGKKSGVRLFLPRENPSIL